MQKKVLMQLHESHQGAVRTKQRACLTVYWLGLDNDTDNPVMACTQCQDHLPSSTKEPLTSKLTPAQLFQELAGDFCYYDGRSYLALVDCYTDWPTIVPMGRVTSAMKLIMSMMELFCSTAILDTFRSDRGPQFMSKQFRKFSEQWGF